MGQYWILWVVCNSVGQYWIVWNSVGQCGTVLDRVGSVELYSKNSVGQ